MGIGDTFAEAFAKAQLGANVKLPVKGNVFISVRDIDKKCILEPAKKLQACGFGLIATDGTAAFLIEKGLNVQRINKVLQGRPHIVDALKNGEVQLVINTTHGAQAVIDSYSIRREALMQGIAYDTTISGASAIADAIAALKTQELRVKPLQDYLATL